MNDYELFECDVHWQNGEKDTVLLAELEFTEGCQIEVIWKRDPEWQGKIETIFDFATVEVKWQDCSTNIVDLKDLLLLNTDIFMEKTVQWKEDFTCAGKITRVAGASAEKMKVQHEVKLSQCSRKPRAHALWESSSESEGSDPGDQPESDGSDLPPSDSEDDMPLECYKKHSSWRIPKSENITEKVFAEIYHGERAILNPIEYFRKYFDDDFLTTLCDRANLYRATKDINTSFCVNKKEMEIYMGITVYMTFVKKGSIRSYWAAGTRYPPIADSMSRNRFESITVSLHFGDKNYNGRTKKFQMIIDRCNSVAKQLYMEENLTIDEQIIAYKGKKSSLRQYNPKKPKKWGWKVFVFSGRIHFIEFYDQDVHVPQGAENINKPGQVVLRIAENIPSDRNFKLYFDNWFNSPGLQFALALRNIWSIGTLILIRAPGLKFDSES